MKRSSKQAADSRGAKSREGRAEKPTTTTFLGSTTRTPHPGPFFLPPQSRPPPLLAHRKYFSLTLFESYQWQAGRQASERWWRSGRNRRLLRLPARSRRASARPWVLAAPSSPSAGGLPTSNRRCSVRRLPHIATTAASPSDSPCFLFSLSPHHTLAAPGSSVVGGGGVGPAFGVFFLFCCGFSGVSAVRFRVRVISCFRLVGCGPVDLAGTVAPIPSVRFVRTRKSDPNRGSPWPAAATCCADSSRFSSARFGEFACSREVSRLNRVWFSAFLRALSWRRAM